MCVVSQSYFLYRLTNQRRAFIYIRSTQCVCKQAVWHIISPVQFTLWWSYFDSLKTFKIHTQRPAPYLEGLHPYALQSLMKYPWQQDRTWNGTIQQRPLLLQPNKTNQYKHTQLSYYLNRVNYILSFIWAWNSWVHSKSTILSLMFMSSKWQSVDIKNIKCH